MRYTYGSADKEVQVSCKYGQLLWWYLSRAIPVRWRQVRGSRQLHGSASHMAIWGGGSLVRRAELELRNKE
jgi:hypothetical protein